MNRMPVATSVVPANTIPIEMNIYSPEILYGSAIRDRIEPTSALREREQEFERVSAANA
jgi:hypothetical protein